MFVENKEFLIPDVEVLQSSAVSSHYNMVQ